jgi:hypothetical protein
VPLSPERLKQGPPLPKCRGRRSDSRHCVKTLRRCFSSSGRGQQSGGGPSGQIYKPKCNSGLAAWLEPSSTRLESQEVFGIRTRQRNLRFEQKAPSKKTSENGSPGSGPLQKLAPLKTRADDRLGSRRGGHTSRTPHGTSPLRINLGLAQGGSLRGGR